MSAVYHNLLLHLPVNIIWRLIGLNRELNKVFLLEYFWKQRCEREFYLLHDTISSYRRYYLIRSDFIRGRLYNDKDEVLLKDIDYFNVVCGKIVYLSHGQLYHFNQDRGSKLLCSGVAHVASMSEETKKLIPLILDDGRRMILSVARDSDGADPFQMIDSPYDPSMIQMMRIYIATGGSLLWVLLENGDLIYVDDRGQHPYAREVVQIEMMWTAQLFILHSDGRAYHVSMENGVDFESVRLGNDLYIKLAYVHYSLYVFTEDGRCEKFVVGHSGNIDIKSTYNSPIPIRTILPDTYEKNVIVTIDGCGTIENPKIQLIKQPLKIDFIGLRGIYGSLVVAVSMR